MHAEDELRKWMVMNVVNHRLSRDALFAGTAGASDVGDGRPGDGGASEKDRIVPHLSRTRQ